MDLNPQVLVTIANGSEDLEATASIDFLSRCGATVSVAKVFSKQDTDFNNLICTMAHGTKLVADFSIEEAKDKAWEMIVVPGGLDGSITCGENEVLINMLKKQKESKKWYCGICAAPSLVFAKNGLIDDEFATCYPMEMISQNIPKKDQLNQKVVVSNNCITSQGPGTAISFALALGEALFGKEKVNEIATMTMCI